MSVMMMVLSFRAERPLSLSGQPGSTVHLTLLSSLSGVLAAGAAVGDESVEGSPGGVVWCVVAAHDVPDDKLRVVAKGGVGEVGDVL
jgi:hypothetical protein